MDPWRVNYVKTIQKRNILNSAIIKECSIKVWHRSMYRFLSLMFFWPFQSGLFLRLRCRFMCYVLSRWRLDLSLHAWYRGNATVCVGRSRHDINDWTSREFSKIKEIQKRWKKWINEDFQKSKSWHFFFYKLLIHTDSAFISVIFVLISLVNWHQLTINHY